VIASAKDGRACMYESSNTPFMQVKPNDNILFKKLTIEEAYTACLTTDTLMAQLAKVLHLFCSVCICVSYHVDQLFQEVVQCGSDLV